MKTFRPESDFRFSHSQLAPRQDETKVFMTGGDTIIIIFLDNFDNNKVDTKIFTVSVGTKTRQKSGKRRFKDSHSQLAPRRDGENYEKLQLR